MIFKQKKFWLLFIVETAVILFIVSQFTAGQQQKPTLDYFNDNYQVSIPIEQVNRLYAISSRRWFGNGEGYSVWQCQDNAPLSVQAIAWQQGSAFQQSLFVTVTDSLNPEKYFLPLQLQQDHCYYLLADGTETSSDDQILLIFTPQIQLGDGLQYKNLLFVIES